MVAFVTQPPRDFVLHRLAPAFFAAAVVTYACGPRPPVGEANARKPESGSRSLTTDVNVSVSEGVSLALRVKNEASRKVEVAFPSGLTHDFEVQDTVGRVVWRWSDGRIFTQAMQNRVLDSDESLSYEADWSPKDHHGQYVAVFSLRSSTHPVEQRVRFSVP